MRFPKVVLELVRPGPMHNQLLSPLTSYLALCGESSPVTLHVDFEHHRLMGRLQRLQYRPGQAEVERQRELVELSEDVGKLLGDIPTLAVEVATARRSCDGTSDPNGDILHLRLVLSGSELSIVPFELARSPQGMPGEGIELLQQGHAPIVLTREIRRSRPHPVGLDQFPQPRLLFAYATPPGMTPVPSNEHLGVLRAALDPWIGPVMPSNPDRRKQLGPDAAPDAERLEDVKEYLRVLPEASLDDIYEACAQEPFSHIHILAHGLAYEQAGETRHGVGLASTDGSGRADVVNGQRLAEALGAAGANGVGRNQPFWVTLMTCDSGAQGSVLVQGGSMAHELHANGIPWVLASQFPLTREGSVKATQYLYPHLLRGDDPRQVLYELRRHLVTASASNHDWASLVTYASLPSDFDETVERSGDRAVVHAIRRKFDAVDAWTLRFAQPGGAPPAIVDGRGSEVDEAAYVTMTEESLRSAYREFDRWSGRLSDRWDTASRQRLTKLLWLRGSSAKRLAVMESLRDNDESARQFLVEARDAYAEGADLWATDTALFLRVATQAVAMSTFVGDRQETLPGSISICENLAGRYVDLASPELRCWGLAASTELALLGLYEHSQPVDLIDEVRWQVVDHCVHLRDTARRREHPGASDGDPLESLAWQLWRYTIGFGGLMSGPGTDMIAPIAAEALSYLWPSWSGRAEPASADADQR